MQIYRVITGVLEENCYIATQDGAQAVVVDPGDNAPDLIGVLRQQKLEPVLILLTHGHSDHTGALVALQQEFGTPVAVHREENGLLEGSVPALDAARFVEGEEVLETAGLAIRVLHTPGHTWGSCCYLINDVLFSGDTLFAGSIGRTDFPEGSDEAMQESLAVLRSLPDDVQVLPGHGPATSIGREKATNPWLR
ncbi:MAG: MBL fold metallo-hydrolase [Clostridia bacterium]|nr:MBL fold metallo-hydrolase [Clostridia bacterium]